MDEPVIEEHAFKHGLTEEEIRYAWSHFLRKRYRGAPNEGEIVAIGFDCKGRLIQMVAMEKHCGILIYHAMTPPTRRVLLELSLANG